MRAAFLALVATTLALAAISPDSVAASNTEQLGGVWGALFKTPGELWEENFGPSDTQHKPSRMTANTADASVSLAIDRDNFDQEIGNSGRHCFVSKTSEGVHGKSFLTIT